MGGCLPEWMEEIGGEGGGELATSQPALPLKTDRSVWRKVEAVEVRLGGVVRGEGGVDGRGRTVGEES